MTTGKYHCSTLVSILTHLCYIAWVSICTNITGWTSPVGCTKINSPFEVSENQFLTNVWNIPSQTKSGDLNEVLRQRDQVLRKNESEMESLNFRNQQLAKRVEILQDELEQSKLKGTSGKKSSHHDHIRDQGELKLLFELTVERCREKAPTRRQIQSIWQTDFIFSLSFSPENNFCLTFTAN